MAVSPQAVGQHRRWAEVADRTAATAKARQAGPGSDSYWTEKIRAKPQFQTADEKTIVKAAASAKKAHFLGLALASTRARSERSRGARDAA